MIPESTSPVPAVARAGTPAADSSTSGTATSGSAASHGGQRALEQHDDAELAGPGPGPRPGGRRPAGSRPGGRTRRRAGVSTVGAVRRPRRKWAAARSPRAVRPSASTTSGSGDEATTAWISSSGGVVGAEARPDHQGPALRRGRQEGAGPAIASVSDARTASTGQGPAGSPGVPRRIMPAPAAMAPRVHRTAEPSMPTEPAAMPSGGGPLVRRPRPGREQGRSVAVLDQRGGRRAGAIPISATVTSPLRRGPVALEESRLVGGEGHRVGGPHRAAGGRTGVGVEARGQVDGQDGRPARHRRGVVAAVEPGAVGAVDHQVARRRAGRAASAASSTVTRTPRRDRKAAATRPSAPLLPLPATTMTRRP